MPKLSIVVTVFNEEENIKPLVKSIFESLQGIDFEIIYVDDGSTDNTVQEIKSLNSKKIKLIEFRKNFGQSSALAGGIDHAEGEYIVTMDGDLQNDPSDIPMLLELAEKEDWDMINGIRANRQDGMFLRKIPSKIANAIIRKTTDVKIMDYGCALKIFKSDIAKNLGLYGELHRFIPVLASLQGARIHQVNVKHHARQFGKSKYGIGRTFRVVSDLLLMLFFKKYMQKPMHLFGTLGVAILGIGVIIDFYLLAVKLMGHDLWGKPLLLLGIMMTLAGIQLITIGIVAELVIRTYFESQKKKPYKIRNISSGENQ
ncbi:MAG: glycosyltransferase family 2 protein [Bacteroidales bacterium]|nr:glycosyltransferase family 2 protein [Bacteroidales bacterium]